MTSDNSKANYKMIDLNSIDRSLDQLKQLNNQLIFDEDRSEKIKKRLKEMTNTYTLEELKWYNIWCDKPCIALLPYEQEVIGKVANKLANKLSEALDEESKTEIDFDLDELTYIKICANNYYGVNLKTDEDTIVLNKLDAKIHCLKYNNITNSYVDKPEEKWAKSHLNVYSLSEIDCFDNWCEHQVVISASLYNKLVDAYGKIATDSTKDIHIQFTLKELKELSNYAKIYHYDAKLSIEEENVLYNLKLRIKYLEKQEKMNNSTEKQEKMNNSTENQEEMKCETPYSKKAINQSWEALHKPDTSPINYSVNQLCYEVTKAMWINEDTLVNIVRECIVNEYNVEYKVKDGVIFKGYITHGGIINYIENGITKLYIRINTPSDSGEDDGTLIINLLEEINLKTIAFKDNTLFLQHKNA